MKGYSFTELAKLVEAAMPRAGGAFSGDVSAPRFIGPLQGNADTATAAGRSDKLSTARNITIGSTTKAFDGTGNLSWSLAEIGAIDAAATVAAAHKWATPRALQIGNSSKAVDGSTNVAWSLAEIGAVNKAGDTMTGTLNFADSGTAKRGIQGTSGANDQWFVGGGATASDAGYMEISTGDNGTEPIYVRQYNGDFVTVARELKLLDANGDTHLPGNLRADVGGVTVKDTNCGMYPGNGDSASSTINNLKLSSWFGIGFGPSIQNQAVPYEEYSHWFNVRNGDMGVRGTITAPQLNGNASTATRLATTRQINGVNFDGTANITVADNTKLPLTGGNLSGPITFTPGSGNVLNFGAAPVIRRFTGANSMSMGVGGDDTLLLGAGESVGIMATNIALGGEDVHIGADNNIYMHVSPDNWATWTGRKTFSIDAVNGPLWAGGKVWNAGNDGAGSGLDADLLDGQDGSYYRNASNINAGTINDAYLPATISSSITGNAATATKLQAARTITLGGDLSGSATFDGSANITITAIVADDSHAHTIANVDGLQTALDGKKTVAVLSGTIAHGGTIPLPSGFTEAQCKWLVSMNTDNPNSTGWDINEGGAHLHYKQQVYTTGRVVTAQTYLGSNNLPPGWISSIANYIIIGVK